MKRLEQHACFGGTQEVWSHESASLSSAARFAVFLPPQAKERPCPVLYWLSGLTCTEQNFITKAGAQRMAAQKGIILVAPDTSPRGDDVADDTAYDLGQGAGFYLNASQEPWARHFSMYDYVQQELPALIAKHFPVNEIKGISGHSMGGHGALILALKNPGMYKSVSACAPIVAPSQVPWGQKAFQAYLGADQENWQQWDTCALIAHAKERLHLLVDVGAADDFLHTQLQLHRLQAVCKTYSHPLTLTIHPDYDHSYYFIASVIDEHLEFHAKAFTDAARSHR